MKVAARTHELPKSLERYIAALAKLYSLEGEKQKLEVLVNSQLRVHEEWSYDNLNGGMYGHALFLTVPESLYLASVREREDIQRAIRDDINKVHNVQNEFIDEVFIEMEIIQDHDWRKESGLILSGKRVITPDAEKRIWGDEGFRLFLSHKTEVKQNTAKLKQDLKFYGVSCFVAHEDILPTQEWQNEIESALCSMDALVALMTEGFHDSLWTDQEVGFAFGRGVPILSVRLGKDPYGFIGKFQALTCTWESAAKEIVKILIKQDKMLNAYVSAVENCPDWGSGNTLACILPFIEKINESQEVRLLAAYNENGEVTGSFGFNGSKPTLYGQGLAFHLNRLTGKTYNRLSDWTLEATL